MNNHPMQVVRNLRPEMFREMARGRENFVTEFRELVNEFRERHRNILSAERRLRTIAYTPAIRRKYEENLAFNRKSLHLILERMTYLRRSLKLVDGILYDGGVSDGSSGRRGRPGSARH